jgi:hypothetical protein
VPWLDPDTHADPDPDDPADAHADADADADAVRRHRELPDADPHADDSAIESADLSSVHDRERVLLHHADAGADAHADTHPDAGPDPDAHEQRRGCHGYSGADRQRRRCDRQAARDPAADVGARQRPGSAGR